MGYVIIISVIFSAVVAIVFMGIASDIVKTWVKSRNSKSIAENEDFLEALWQFKQKTDGRLSKIETMLGKESETQSKKRSTQSADNRNMIEIDEKKEEVRTENSSRNLKNMLKE